MKTSPITLLIVDDDPVFTLFVRQLLLTLGEEFTCEPQNAGTAEEAIAELHRANYDLVLLDYHLPGADGLQMLAQIRELPANRQPAVIMLTASGNEMVAVEAMKRGARDYVPKVGLDVAPLLRVLRNALVEKRLADELAQQTAQTRADLEMARRFQQSLLPDSYPVFPHPGGKSGSSLHFCHRFFPASELAGDFFHVLQISGTQAGIFICDVMGHGVRSALVAATVRGLIDYAAPSAAQPAKFMGRINQRLTTLLKAAETPLFATAFYMVAEPLKRRLRYSTAGHPAPVRLQRSDGRAGDLGLPRNAGPALGLFPDATYECAESAYEPGDVVLLFTDGLLEATNPEGQEEYGRGRLLQAVQAQNLLPIEALCDQVMAGVKAFAGGTAFADDVCLVSIQSTAFPVGTQESRAVPQRTLADPASPTAPI